MTDLSAFGTTDAVLWSLAVVLTCAALWLGRARPATWELDSFFAVTWGAMRRPAPLPLREGAVPAGGWTGDPAELGPDYDPIVRLGQGCSWDALAEGRPEALPAIRRRLDRVRAVWWGAPVFDLPELPTVRIDDPTTAEATLETLLDASDLRVVHLTRERPGAVLRALHELGGLRDATLLVVFIGAELDGERDWIAKNFHHASMDLELHDRRLVFATLRVEGGGAQVLRHPETAAVEVLQVVDLGITPAESLSDPALPRALVASIAAVAAG